MKIARNIVLGFGLFYIVFGLCFALAPVKFFAMSTGETLKSPAGISEIRAVYGGLGIGAGIWMFICHRENIRLGLLGLIFTTGSIAVFRTVGLVIDGAVESTGILYLLSEVAITLTGFASLKALNRHKSSG